MIYFSIPLLYSINNKIQKYLLDRSIIRGFKKSYIQRNNKFHNKNNKFHNKNNKFLQNNKFHNKNIFKKIKKADKKYKIYFSSA
jgi:hypothetical protein